MNDDPKLRRALRDHYDAQSMRPETLARLTSVAAPRRRVLAWSAGIAAVLLAGFGLLFLSSENDALADTIAREVAIGHNKNYAPDVALSFPAVCGEMKKLEFTMCDPGKVVAGCETQGARYCSIQGQPAAQIKVVKQGRRSTIYQCKDDPLFDEIENGEVRVVDGVEVRMSRENGLLICVATNVTGP